FFGFMRRNCAGEPYFFNERIRQTKLSSGGYLTLLGQRSTLTPFALPKHFTQWLIQFSRGTRRIPTILSRTMRRKRVRVRDLWILSAIRAPTRAKSERDNPSSNPGQIQTILMAVPGVRH